MKTMKCITKRIVVMVLSVALLLSLVPMTALAAEDPGSGMDDWEIAGELELDQTISVSADEGEVYYAFTPAEDGVYKIYSSESDTDTYVTMYDENQQTVAEDDDSGEESNFSLVEELEAGKTYYYGVRAYSKGSFNFNITLVKTNFVNVIFRANHKDAYYEEYNDELEDFQHLEYMETTLEAERTVDNNTVDTPYVSADGIIFTGWSTNPNATEPDENIVASEGLELYAVWAKEYTVTFQLGVGTDQAYYLEWDDDNETEHKVSSHQNQYAEGDDVVENGYSLPEKPDDSIEIVGWSTNPNAAEPDKEIIVNGDMTLYAVWRHEYTVTFDANGGYLYYDEEEKPVTVENETVWEGDRVNLRDVYHSDFKKVFDGWYDQKTGGNKVTGSLVVSGDMTLYAHWSDAKTETIKPDTITQTTAGASQFVYQFTSQETGLYLFNSAAVDNYINPDVSLYGNDGKQVDLNVTTYDDKDFSATCNLEKGKTYTFVIRNANQSINAYPLKIAKIATAKITFDTNRKGVTFEKNKKETLEQQAAIGFGLNTDDLEMNVPESEDAAFSGWSADPEATEGEYYITPHGDMTLYAVWENYCHVTFDANGGYFYVDDEPADRTVSDYIEGDYISYYDLPQIDDKGYVFAGWSTDKNAVTKESGIRAEDGLVLYAVWAKKESSEEDTVKVTFDANHENAVIYDSVKTVIEELTPGERIYQGWHSPYLTDGDDTIRFVGWSKDPNATEADEDIFAEKNLTVYAVWKKAVKVTYDTNGVSISDAYLEDYDWESGEYVKSKTYSTSFAEGDRISDYNTPIVINGKLRFLGWSANKGATEADDTITAGDKPLTLYAVWGSNAIITYDTNGGFFDTGFVNKGLIGNTQIKKGDTFDNFITPQNADITKVFAGWATKPDATEPDLTYETKVTDDMTVYAVWQDGIKVTIDANGGYFKENGKKVTSIVDYVLPGEYVGQVGDRAYHTDERKADWGRLALTEKGEAVDDQTQINSPMTLYVKWVDLVNITFDAQDGSISDEVTRTVQSEKGTTYDIPSYRQATSNDVNKAFVGWSTKKGDETAIVTSLKADQDITLYAIYREGYKVILDSAETSLGTPGAHVNGKYINGETTDKSFIWAKNVPASDLDLYGNAKDGYIFLGYSTSKERKDIISDSWTPSKNDTTLYAIFVPGFHLDFWASEGRFASIDSRELWMQIEKDETIGIVENPVPPEGKVFVGWEYYDYSSTTKTGSWKQVEDIATLKPSMDMSFRAIYSDSSKPVLTDVTLASTSATFTGSAINPGVTVKYNGKTLTQNTDYTVAYSNNVNAGTATVTVTGKGDYTGTVTKTFKINPANLANATVTAATTTWTGSAQKPAVTAKYSGVDLKENTDFTAAYSNNVNAGNGTVTLTGKGNYTGTKTATFRIQFSDVTDATKFYYEPIYWAVDYKGITKGWDDGTFRYMNDCTRAAVVTFMWRHAGSPKPSKQATFKDMTGNEDFDNAISWAVEQGIVKGWSDNTFRPWRTCNRAAMMTFFYRYAGSPKVTGTNTFKDKTGNAEFDRAIAWGVSNGITTGWDDNTFRPWRTCNRLATVTFLYRYHKSR